MKGLVALITAAVVCSTGCAPYVFEYPVAISTRSTSIPAHTVVGQVREEYCNRLILFLPITKLTSEIWEEAMEEAERMGADALIDVQASPTSNLMIFPVYAHFCFEVQGVAVKFGAPDA